MRKNFWTGISSIVVLDQHFANRLSRKFGVNKTNPLTNKPKRELIKPKEKVVLKIGWKGIEAYFEQCRRSEQLNKEN